MDKGGIATEEIFEIRETKWRPVYPMPNNTVTNAGITAVRLLKGEGDYLKTLSLACSAGDNTDADCSGASAGAVVSAIGLVNKKSLTRESRQQKKVVSWFYFLLALQTPKYFLQKVILICRGVGCGSSFFSFF